MRWAMAVSVVLSVASCQRCRSGAPAVVDAGGAIRPQVRSTDLRTALLMTYPETRGASILRARASLVREVEGLADPMGSMTKSIQAMGFTPVDAGLVGGEKAPLHSALLGVDGGVAEMALWIDLGDEAVARIFGAPTSLSSMEMALYLPRDPGQRVVFERFGLDIDYRTINPNRAAFMSKQVLELLERNGLWQFKGARPWAEDAGVEGDFTATIVNPDEHSALEVRREGTDVFLRYTLDTQGG